MAGRISEVSESAVINASTDAIWMVISDTSRYAEWVAGVSEVTEHHGTAEVGKTYSERNHVLGPWKASTTWTVVQADAPLRRLDTGIGLPLVHDVESIFELEPVVGPDDAQSTRFTYIARYRIGLGPVGKLIDRIQQPAQRSAFRSSIANLAKLVESRPTGSD